MRTLRRPSNDENDGRVPLAGLQPRLMPMDEHKHGRNVILQMRDLYWPEKLGSFTSLGATGGLNFPKIWRGGRWILETNTMGLQSRDELEIHWMSLTNQQKTNVMYDNHHWVDPYSCAFYGLSILSFHHFTAKTGHDMFVNL